MEHEAYDELRMQLIDPLSAVLGSRLTVDQISLLAEPKTVADDVAKFLVRSVEAKPTAVVLCSPSGYKDMVARGMCRARAAKDALGTELGRVVLRPLSEGRINGRSYAIHHYCHPLSAWRPRWWVQRCRLLPTLVKWLRGVAATTGAEVQPEELEPRFVRPLTHLVDLSEMPQRVRFAAGRALERLANGTWRPKHVLMHNDLWQGNILLDQRRRSEGTPRGKRSQFVIIDWAGSELRGYAILDLVRLAQSLRLGSRQLRRELCMHCESLGCEPQDATSHMLAGLGYLGMNLECFPFDRYVRQTEDCMETIDRTAI